jgi:hypothetical protein
LKIAYKRVDHKATPTNNAQRKEIVRLRDVEKLSWRKIAAQMDISFQRVCQIYERVKEQSGQVNNVKKKEVLDRVKVSKKRAVKTKDLTPDALDSIIDLSDKTSNIKL